MPSTKTVKVKLEKSFIRVMGKRRSERALAAARTVAKYEIAQGRKAEVRLFAVGDTGGHCIKCTIFVNGGIGRDPSGETLGYSWRIFTVEWSSKTKRWEKQPSSQKDDMIASLERVAGLVGKVPYLKLGGEPGNPCCFLSNRVGSLPRV